jgi:hypothetical protein
MAATLQALGGSPNITGQSITFNTPSDIVVSTATYNTTVAINNLQISVILPAVSPANDEVFKVGIYNTSDSTYIASANIYANPDGISVLSLYSSNSFTPISTTLPNGGVGTAFSYNAGDTLTILYDNTDIKYIITRGDSPTQDLLYSMSYTASPSIWQYRIQPLFYVSGNPVNITSADFTISYIVGGGGGGGGSVPCFLATAPVLTPSGYTKISQLKEGDMVLSNGASVPIIRTSVTRVAAGPSVNPYSIPKGQFGATKQLLISPDHKVAVDGGRLVEAKHLGLEQVSMEGEIEYYNIEIEGNGNMTVAGVEVESLAPVRRVELTSAQFAALLKAKYGAAASSPAVLQMIARTCRILPDGRVNCPVLRK